MFKTAPRRESEQGKGKERDPAWVPDLVNKCWLGPFWEVRESRFPPRSAAGPPGPPPSCPTRVETPSACPRPSEPLLTPSHLHTHKNWHQDTGKGNTHSSAAPTPRGQGSRAWWTFSKPGLITPVRACDLHWLKCQLFGRGDFKGRWLWVPSRRPTSSACPSSTRLTPEGPPSGRGGGGAWGGVGSWESPLCCERKSPSQAETELATQGSLLGKLACLSTKQLPTQAA